MDLTQLLPYEILQHIATWLLPRYQCRLAMASKYHYQHLYSYLLKWHAKWHLIPIPQHKILQAKKRIISMLVTPEKPRVLIIHGGGRGFNTMDLTNKSISEIYPYDPRYAYVKEDDYCYIDTLEYDDLHYELKLFRKLDILAGYYRYLHKTVLLWYINMQKPVHSLSFKLYYYVCNYLNGCDRYNFTNSCIMYYAKT